MQEPNFKTCVVYLPTVRLHLPQKYFFSIDSCDANKAMESKWVPKYWLVFLALGKAKYVKLWDAFNCGHRSIGHSANAYAFAPWQKVKTGREKDCRN